MRESSNFWNIIPGPWNPPRRGKIGSNENYRRTHARRPGGNGSPDRARLRGAPRCPFRSRRPFRPALKPRVRATRVLLVGAGKPEKFDAAEMRRLSGAAVRYLKAKSIKTVALAVDADFAGDDFAAAAIEGALLGDFEPDRYKTGDDKKSLDAFALAADTPGLDAAVERGRVLGEAQNFTRGLVNEPANRLTPEYR